MTVEAFSDDDLLENVLWMIGRCFEPGNERHKNEAMALLGTGHTWRLQLNLYMATPEQLQAGRNRSFLSLGGNQSDNEDTTAKRR